MGWLRDLIWPRKEKTLEFFKISDRKYKAVVKNPDESISHSLTILCFLPRK